MKSVFCRVTALEMISALGRNVKEVSQNLTIQTCLLTSSDEFLVNGETTYLGVAPVENLPRLASQGEKGFIIQLADILYEGILSDLEAAKNKWEPQRIAVILGTSTGGMAETERAYETWYLKDSSTPLYDFYQNDLNCITDHIQKRWGVKGPCYTISTACSSSAHTFGVARQLMQAGRIDAALVGGIDTLCKLTINGFHSLELVGDDWCDPFSENNGCLNIGEGGCFALLEKEAGGTQLVGYGASSDGFHMTAPTPEGAVSAMQSALNDAEFSSDDIDYINLHGTGTKQNDHAESTAVHEVFGAEVPCSSTKHLTGHCLGATGAIELGILWLLLQPDGPRNLPPQLLRSSVNKNNPQINLVQPSYKVAKNRKRAFLSNSFAFGGNNCSLILARDEENGYLSPN